MFLRVPNIAPWFVGLLLWTAIPCAAEEKWNYQVDRAALSAQDRAIAKLSALTKKFTGSYRQQLLLVKIIEAMGSAAKLEFRIAHGKSQLQNSKLDLNAYEKRLKDVIAKVTVLVEEHPSSEWLESMLLTRAHAHKELKQKELAKKDLLFVANHAPGTEWAVRANLGLGELAIESGDYRGAIGHLTKIEQMPQDPRYPFALYQIGWAHFNLDEVPQAVEYLTRQVRYYRDKQQASAEGKLSSADQALREQSLRDLVAFYFSRFDKEDPAFPLSRALDSLQGWEEGPYLGRMMLHFAKLLQSRDRLDALEKWTAQVIEEEAERPEILEIAALYFEYTAEKQMLVRLERGAEFFRKIRSDGEERMVRFDTFAPTLERILQAGANLQGELSRQKQAHRVSGLRRLLAVVFRTYQDLAPPTDPKLPQVRYNLAEIDFAEGNYPSAAEGFRWLVKNGGEKPPVEPEVASLRAIVSDYQHLREKDLLPKEIQAGAPSGDDDPDFSDLPEDLGRWVRTIYEHLDEFGRKPEDFETFEFEGYRALYARGQTRAALEGMVELVEERPTSSTALPAANLVLDSYLLSGGEDALRVVEKFKALTGLGKKDFKTRLRDVPAEVSYRLMEKAYQDKDFDRALALGADYLSEYGDSQWTPHALWIAARSAMERKEGSKARAWLTRLLDGFPKSDRRPLALLARAGLLEESYEFDAAARDYHAYFQTPNSSNPEVSRRLFFTSWMAADAPPLDCDRHDGTDELKRECERTRALISLNPGAKPPKDAGTLARKGPQTNRGAWGAVALSHLNRKLSYAHRLAFARTVAEQWSEWDPLIQFALIPVLNRSVPIAFSRSRELIPRVAPLKSDTNALVKRINTIKRFEDAAGQVVEVPWSQVKVAVLGAVGETYSDFCDELAKLPTPKDLSPDELRQYRASINEVLTPFGEKRDTIRGQVKELAAKSPIEPGLVPGLKGGAPRALASSPDRTSGLVKALLPAPPANPTAVSEPTVHGVAELWASSLEAEHWARVGFFFRELKDRYKVGGAPLGALRAVALARAGALPEAVAELESVERELNPAARPMALELLSQWYATSTQPEKAKAFLSTSANRSAAK